MLHQEKHIRSSQPLKDLVLGLADGLTVPFALAAGLSGAVDSTHIVIIACLAEIAAGGISMGLGGYLAAKAEAEHYAAEYQRESYEIDHLPDKEVEETLEILQDFGVPEAQRPKIVDAISSDKEKWIDFMMRFELGLEKPHASNIWLSPLRIGLAYVIGGLVPLAPYFFYKHIHAALSCSIIVTLFALFIFGSCKAYFMKTKILVSALQTTLIGALASATAFVVVKSFS